MQNGPRPPATLDTVLDAVGPRLRALRKQRGGTLEQLADRTGISASTLSRLESGQRRPTLELLLPLAREYQVPLDELVGAPPTGDPRIHPRPVRHHGRTLVPLSRTPGGSSTFKLIMPVGDSGGDRLELRSHEGHEWFYVIAGKLRLALGAEDFVFGPGEAAEFDCRVPHGFANAGTTAMELLIIFGPQGERIHFRGTG